ncbi:glycosyltransferase family 4 protein [Membranihabitans maritimus]|uniref:glycosyltransferase family 4 protein n=1 Tax=Membranihabitans maritimus TaxID=2904244 RepID=UPI001F23C86E|nr:MraY family glycosyltransferase [Membranihabitans maritimus]
MYDIILSFITALVVTFYAIPSIIKVAKIKQLVDMPGERRSHDEITPSLGGIAIFAGVLFSIVLWTPFNLFGDLQYILCAFTIIFLIGVKDDIVPISPKKKFAGEIFAAIILVTKSNIRLTSFHGLFGIYEIPFWFSFIVSMVTILLIINAFNLIDGINGLTGCITVLITSFMSAWFFLVDHLALSLIAFSTAGACIAFLYYNMTPAKIFMGDTGALFIGLICSILSIQFIEVNNVIDESRFAIHSAPVVAIGILAIPVFDTLRVFSIRILKGRSPFTADRQHIHHMMVDAGFTHMVSSVILTAFNALIIYMVLSLQNLNINFLLAILIGTMVIFTTILFYASRPENIPSKGTEITK